MAKTVARLTRPALRMGLFAAFVLAAIPPEDAPDAKAMIYEEMGWGDSGLAISIGAGGWLPSPGTMGNLETMNRPRRSEGRLHRPRTHR